MRDDRWRLIRSADGSEELYDHRHDRHEWDNRAGDPKCAKAVTCLQQALPSRAAPRLEKK